MIYDIIVNNEIIGGIKVNEFFTKETLNNDMDLIPWKVIFDKLKTDDEKTYKIELEYKQSVFNCEIIVTPEDMRLKRKFRRGRD